MDGSNTTAISITQAPFGDVNQSGLRRGGYCLSAHVPVVTKMSYIVIVMYDVFVTTGTF